MKIPPNRLKIRHIIFIIIILLKSYNYNLTSHFKTSPSRPKIAIFFQELIVDEYNN